jgi:hypothetical protein
MAKKRVTYSLLGTLNFPLAETANMLHIRTAVCHEGDLTQTRHRLGSILNPRGIPFHEK